MKLYDVPPLSIIKLLSPKDTNRTPPDSPKLVKGRVLTFIKLDGAYSICFNNRGEIVHLGASTEVEVLA